MTLYKVLDANGTSPYACHPWHLPTDGQPGEWMPAVEGDLVPCERGYHLCREADLVQWLGAAIYEAELEPGSKTLEGGNKLACRGPVRLVTCLETWNDTTARLFAADCAERVLPIWERRYPKDGRPRQAIEAARAFARGEINDRARDAAWAAAWDAAGAAAGAAAWDAAQDAARAAARAAARDAAWAAAGTAAWAAAGDAARDAEREWQTTRLMQYLRGEVS